jgi:hypothetical protein
MANNCYFSASITGEDDEGRLSDWWDKNLVQNNPAVQYMTDLPDIYTEEEKESKDVYEHAGTKWVSTGHHDDNSISGDSAWSPPLELFRRLSKFFNCTISISYEEPGCAIFGHSIFTDGYIDEEISYDTYIEYLIEEEGDTEYATERLLEMYSNEHLDKDEIEYVKKNFNSFSQEERKELENNIPELRVSISEENLKLMEKGSITVMLQDRKNSPINFPIPKPGKSKRATVEDKVLVAFGKEYRYEGVDVSIGRSHDGQEIYIKSTNGPVFYKPSVIRMSDYDISAPLKMSVTLQIDR